MSSQPRSWSDPAVGSELPSLSPDELAAAGHALFGPRWRTQLARALGVTKAELAAVELGVRRSPPEWRAKLIMLAQDAALRAMEAASNLLCFGDEAPPTRPSCPSPLLRYA